MLSVLSVVATDHRVYPRRKFEKRSVLPLAVLLAAALLSGGCGGGGSKQAESHRVQGRGFSLAVPGGWTVERSARAVSVKRGDGPALASVTVLALRKAYRPALFDETARELDRVSDALAAKLGGKVVARRTIVVAGRRARQYDLAYQHAGTGLIDRITYVLRRTTEYYLLCRWQVDEGEPVACALLTASFRLR
jgi:hypothetical protein